ncbi:hypothetical protein QUF58_05920, partial [Anaerolineales bacterium HSG24]|nr:hypothetical protein [Anaerolineales bacterium HSG24]
TLEYQPTIVSTILKQSLRRYNGHPVDLPLVISEDGDVEPILLEPDVYPFFPDAQSVNNALRLLIELSQQTKQIDVRQQELLRNIVPVR